VSGAWRSQRLTFVLTVVGLPLEYTIKLLMPTYDNEILEAALIGYEHRKREIEAKIEQLRIHLGGHVAQVREASVSGRRRSFSAATRKRMAAAQQKRWAAKNAVEAVENSVETATEPKATKKNRAPLSSEARERIAAAQRKRWAKTKKAAKEKQ
jgi:hypothetical protein